MIKVLREGVHERNSENSGYTVWHPICSSATLIQTEGINILVDPGHFALADELNKLLAQEGLKPEDINFVFITHHHLDHSSNMGAFEHAKIYLGDGYVDRTAPAYKVFQNLEQVELPSTVKIVSTPGHTMESVSLLYEEEGVKYMCVGDAVREDALRAGENLGYADDELYWKWGQKIFKMADVIIPGHGRVIEGEIKKELQKLIESK